MFSNVAETVHLGRSNPRQWGGTATALSHRPPARVTQALTRECKEELTVDLVLSHRLCRIALPFHSLSTRLSTLFPPAFPLSFHPPFHSLSTRLSLTVHCLCAALC